MKVKQQYFIQCKKQKNMEALNHRVKMSIHVTVLYANDLYANKSRHTYVCDIHQLSNPTIGVEI